MRESRSYGSVGVRGGNEPLYPEKFPGFPGFKRVTIYLWFFLPRR